MEGFDLFPYLSGAVPSSPREEVWLGSDSPTGGAPSAAFVQGLIRADGMKLLHDVLLMNMWQGPFYPNQTTAAGWSNAPYDCGPLDAPTCLFNVFEDPTEHNNIAAANPDVVAAMAARIKQLNAGVFSPDRGEPSPLACNVSAGIYRGFIGPFLP